MNQVKIFILLTMIIPFSLILTAEDLTDPQEIIKRAELAAYYSGNDGRSAARMTIIDNQGRKQIRQFTILRKDQEDGGSQDMMVFFSRPADIRGTVFRVVKNIEKEDDRWLYLPGLDLIKRISSGDKRTSFVGSHFFYEDVSGRSTKQDNFTLLKTDENYYVLEAKPKVAESVEFSRYEITIDKSNLLPMIINFYNAENILYRSVKALKVETISGHPTVTHSRVEDKQNGGQTDMQFRFIAYDLGLPDNVFSERNMRIPPRKWLKTN